MACDCHERELPAWVWFGIAGAGILFLVWLGGR